MGEAARKFLDRLVLRVGGTASERARYRCYAEQRLACVNADGAARLVLSFKNHIRRRGGTVVRTARDLRLPQVPEAPVDTHRPREATAVARDRCGRAQLVLLPSLTDFLHLDFILFSGNRQIPGLATGASGPICR